MTKRILVLCLVLFAFQFAKAQTQKEFSGSLPKAPETSAQEQVHQKDFQTHHKIKPFKWKRTRVTHTAEYEFYKRVEKAAKEHQRALRKLHRPQYSDFLYYGHKHKPRKHAPGKLRYCKECGIRH